MKAICFNAHQNMSNSNMVSMFPFAMTKMTKMNDGLGADIHFLLCLLLCNSNSSIS